MIRWLRTIRTWAEMVKFPHSLFALPFALLATFLAARPALPTWSQLGLIVWCMVAARSAAMTFNRLADASFDAANPRAAGRPLPRGTISRVAACFFFVVAGLAFLAGCAGFLVFHANPWPLGLGLPVLALLCLYSYTKRFTLWSHVILGAGIACASVAAWILSVCSPGDANCDGDGDFDDINPFVLAISDPAAYAATYPDCDVLNGDCNDDGFVDFDDINPLVAILTGG